MAPPMFYMTPGSCSTGIHVLLETLELPFQVTVLNLPAGEHRRPEYLAINPQGTIPALRREDGRVLVGFQAIALWLARAHPRARLLPEDPWEAAHVVASMDHLVATVHGQAYTRVFTPERYLPEGLFGPDDATGRATAVQAIEAQGRRMVLEHFDIVEAGLKPDAWLSGPDFGIADAAFLYVAFWADRLALALPAGCEALYRRLLARPVVRSVLAEEGYRLTAPAAPTPAG